MLARGSGASRFRLILLMMLFCGVLSALISVNGAVAALLPVVVVLAVRLKRPPSQLLMPLVFGAHAGSMLALTGTPVNVLVYEASLEAGSDGFGYFEFAYVGVFLVIGTILIALVLGSRLLPVRENRSLPPTSASTPGRSSSSSASTTGCTCSGCARNRRWSGSRGPGSISAGGPG